MLLPMPEVLSLPSFRAARITVLAGDPEQTRVRWVHSSEVYEMGGLLAGGEILLTTGLGLHGRPGQQLAAYVDQVADAGCAAIAMELGRSFFEVPQAMVDAARRRDLVLLGLRSVVPFERMAEDFHELLLRRKTGPSSSGEPLWRDLLAVVVAGDGMRSLLDAVSRAAGCVVEFHDVDGRVVERSRIMSRESTNREHAVEVRGPLGPLGSLVLRASATRRRAAVAERAAIAVALELGRTPDLGRRPSPAQSLVTDLAAGVLVSQADIARRLGEVGWADPVGQHLVVAVVDAGARTPVDDVVRGVRETWTAPIGTCVSGAVGSHVVVLLNGGTRVAPQRLRQLLVENATLLRDTLNASALPVVGVSQTSADLTQAPRLLTSAREVVRMAQRAGTRSGVVMARDVGLQRLLSTVEASQLNDFVSEQIGPLIDQDRRHGSELVRTLGTYLACGISKARAAEVLGLRRQSLYARLARIEAMLGVSMDDAGHRTALETALLAWRMRTGLDPSEAFGHHSVRRQRDTPADIESQPSEVGDYRR